MKAKEPNQWAKALIGAIMAVGVGTTALEAGAADSKEPEMEKCYGIVKKGMNDCGTSTHSCQGVAPKNNDSSEWIFVPKGTCSKIVGGVVK